MNKKSFLLIGIFVFAVGVLYFVSGNHGSLNDTKQDFRNGQKVVIYKSPNCGCCGSYAKYLKQKGYSVEIISKNDLDPIKNKLGVPSDLESCHTAQIGDYVVEGHIPEVAVQKLLTEKPDIEGIGMAGMPSGSPGMPGQKTGDFIIYTIIHNGVSGDVFMTI